MMKNSKILKNCYSILMLLATSISFAQDFDEDVVDNQPVSPIDNYVILALFLALLYVFYIMKKVGYRNKGAKAN